MNTVALGRTDSEDPHHDERESSADGSEVTRAAAEARPASQVSRVAWVDAAKGMSIVLVVALHVTMYLEATGQAPALLIGANTALASMRMPLFFLASGFFAAGPLAASWRTLLHKRVAFFLYLYTLWTLIRFAFFLAVPGVVDIYDTTDPTFLALALVLPGPGL